MNIQTENIVLTENGDLAIKKKGEVSREAILSFEEMMSHQEGVFYGDTDNCPLEHSFSDGIYVRQITIPAGTLIVGKIHKHEHPNFLLKGEVVMITEEGRETINAPCSMISKPGTKRALYAITELVWTTVHHNPTNTQDLEELEKIVIAPSYDAYDKFIAKKETLFYKLKEPFIKKIRIWLG